MKGNSYLHGRKTFLHVKENREGNAPAGENSTPPPLADADPPYQGADSSGPGSSFMLQRPWPAPGAPRQGGGDVGRGVPRSNPGPLLVPFALQGWGAPARRRPVGAGLSPQHSKSSHAEIYSN